MNTKIKNPLTIFFLLAALPMVLTGLFVVLVRIQGQFRFDPVYFNAQYQEKYFAPGVVAQSMEQVIHNGDMQLYAELTGLRKMARPPAQNPNVHLAILYDVNQAGYFQYLYFDVKTYHRSTYYVKEEMGRWVVVPEDAYFYLDSGRWLLVFTPLIIIWWAILLTVGLGKLVFNLASRFRRDIFHLTG